MKAELWDLLRGFESIHDQGMTAVEVDSDLAVAVKMITRILP